MKENFSKDRVCHSLLIIRFFFFPESNSWTLLSKMVVKSHRHVQKKKKKKWKTCYTGKIFLAWRTELRDLTSEHFAHCRPRHCSEDWRGIGVRLIRAVIYAIFFFIWMCLAWTLGILFELWSNLLPSLNHKYILHNLHRYCADCDANLFVYVR